MKGGIISYSREIESLTEEKSVEPSLLSSSESKPLDHVLHSYVVTSLTSQHLSPSQPQPSYSSSSSSSASPHLTRNVINSKFRGYNYVFDQRMSSKITNDDFSCCETCGDLSSLFINCANSPCHVSSEQIHITFNIS